MSLRALEQLARDIADNFACGCYTDDLETEDCPCGGDGRDEDGNSGAFEGCWNCQARAALAEPDAVRCIDCNDEMEHAGNQGRCRDCNIDFIVECCRCKCCGWWRTNGLLWPQQTHHPMPNCPWMAL